MSNVHSRVFFWITLSLSILVADQITKFWVNYVLIDVTVLFPWLNLTLVHNRGASFGFLDQAGGWQKGLFIVIGLVASVWILCQLTKRLNDDWFKFGLSLILGGALGNLCDRFILGYVIDFIDFHIGNWHFFIFNVADVAISLGALLCVIRAR